jgi:hypothetical protein
MSMSNYIGRCHPSQVRQEVHRHHRIQMERALSPIYTNNGASDFCHVRLILPGCPSDFAMLSNRNFPISPSDFVQCDVRQSDAYKNQMDLPAKIIRTTKIRLILAVSCK